MKKILIIEDQQLLREEVCDWFCFEGYITYSAANGREGMDLARKHLPHLILCDIMMPEMNGNQVLSALRSEPSTSVIPFIFMTALSERDHIRTGMEQGADDYITKPFTREELLNAVTMRLEKTDAVHRQSESHLEELRKNLLTSLPHELRTPLNGILGFGQLLKDHPDTFEPGELPVIGERIYASAMRLYRLIQNYLLYAQLELQKHGPDQKYELMNPHEVCRETCLKVATNRNRTDDLILKTGTGTVFMPEPEFAKLVEELTDNAFKFSVSGQKVTVRCDATGEHFNLIVEDEGRGISPEDLKKIGAFMQFERRIYEQQGFGLGLVIAKKIAQLFRGHLSVMSEHDHGTRIRVTLPGAASIT